MKWFKKKDPDDANDEAPSSSSDSPAAKDDAPPKKPPNYCITATSNLLFLIGSVLYVVLAVFDLRWEKETQDIPDFVLNADDGAAVWELYPELGDDIVFHARYYPVSQYQIVYFFAALAFLIEGFVDFFGTPGLRGFCFIQAGAFGLVSCFLEERDPRLADIFNSISAHLFVLEALGLLFNRESHFGRKRIVRTSDAFFVIATAIDTALSYCAIFNVYNLSLSRLDVSAATLWLACACIYVAVTIWAKHKGFFDPNGPSSIDDKAGMHGKAGDDGLAVEDDVAVSNDLETPAPINATEEEKAKDA